MLHGGGYSHKPLAPDTDSVVRYDGMRIVVTGATNQLDLAALRWRDTPSAARRCQPKEGTRLSTVVEVCDATAVDASLVAPEACQTDGEPMLGALDPAWRVLVGTTTRDDEFWRFLAAVSLLYLALGTLLLPAFDRSVDEEVRRRGQVDDPTSVSIELVEAPDEPANARHDRSGLEQPAEPRVSMPEVSPPSATPAEARPPSAAPPATVQHPSPPEPSQTPAAAAANTEPVTSLRPSQPPDEQAEPSEPEKPAATHRVDPDKATQALADAVGVDLTMRDYASALDAEIARRKQAQEARRAAPPPSAVLSGSSRLRGAPSSGRSDAYSRSVIAALLRAKPPPFALRGSVMVSFEISQSGGLVYVRVLDSSGNKAMDAEAVAAIRRARFDPPPPGKSRADLTYIIHFIFD